MAPCRREEFEQGISRKGECFAAGGQPSACTDYIVFHARVKQGLSVSLDAEALQVVSNLRGWTPGRLDGELTDVLFTQPVTFAIR
jgi:hypothetical protein